MKEARRLLISGAVQGVGFRDYLIRTATRLGVTGWVRNRRDGRVEALVAGTPETIAATLHWARKGPPAAIVEQVFVEAVDLVEYPPDFLQRETT